MVQATGVARALAAREVRAMEAVPALADGVEEAEAGGGVKDALHNSLRSVAARPRAIRCVAFLANSWAIGCKKTPCASSRSVLPPTREGYAGIPRFLRLS